MNTDQQVIIFKVLDSYYAIPAEKTREIHGMVAYRSLPKSKKYITGVYSYRDRVIPLINMRMLLHNCSESAKQGQVLVVTWQENNYGLMVDNITQLASREKLVSRKKLECDTKASKNADFSFGQSVLMIEEKTIIELDLEKLLEVRR